MSDRETRRTAAVFLVDGLLLLFSFMLMHYLAEATLTLSASYRKLLMLACVFWFIVSFWFKKFDLPRYGDPWGVFKTVLFSSVTIIYLLSIAIIILGTIGFARRTVFGTFILLAILETLCVYLWQGFFRTAKSSLRLPKFSKPHLSLRLAVLDFVAFVIAYYIVNVWHTKTWHLYSRDFELFLILIGGWLFTVLGTTKYEKRHYHHLYHGLWRSFVAAILLAGFMSILVFAFDLFHFSRTIIFGSILLWYGFSSFLSALYFYKRLRWRDEDIHSVQQVMASMRQEALTLPPGNGSNGNNGRAANPQKWLANVYFKDHEEIFHFIASRIPLDEVEKSDCAVMKTNILYNFDTLANTSLNLHRINDFRRINYYFLMIHAKLYNGGYFVGCKEPCERVRQKFLAKYPEQLALILYSIHFIFFRIWPKLPLLKKIYFAVTRGRNRVLSRAELFGRLSFCGFKIISEKTIDNNLFFIAQKIKIPSLDQEPSYGPLIKIKKIGFGGKVIEMRKFRTMHPYSEYIQDYVFTTSHLHSSGKFQDDFRLAAWGRVLRSFWLDELPQIYNWIRGDVALFGVRALSGHYFSLYPKELQELRIQFKPGLIPPYYADLPKSFDEIVASEFTYLRRKQIQPVRTDLIYLAKAVTNILKGARSR